MLVDDGRLTLGAYLIIDSGSSPAAGPTPTLQGPLVTRFWPGPLNLDRVGSVTNTLTCRPPRQRLQTHHYFRKPA